MPRKTREPKSPTSKPNTKPTTLPEDFPTNSFPTISSFESFLSTHHNTLPGLYLKLAKKSSGIQSITAAEAVEVALCFGWIDGRSNSLDETHWTVRYTPRRAKSLWSAKNVATVARLIEEGRMRSAGLEAVEAAKRDGRWERAYDGPAGIEVPGDLERMLNKKGNEHVRGVWEGWRKSKRYAVLHRLQVGSRDVMKRGRVIEGVLEMLRDGDVGGSSGQEKGKVKTEKAYKVEKKTVTKAEKETVERASRAKVSKSKINDEASILSIGGTSTRQLRSRKPAPL
ncbi:YdeI/OmpD-associated family protein [Aspergillus stella-maris]|uniref:YdeI/OmpD-associated family protein n=1 Tax=Aspergillus stella-maris TaxID=1810926 RepID=UPI003CCE40A2